MSDDSDDPEHEGHLNWLVLALVFIIVCVTLVPMFTYIAQRLSGYP